MKEIEKVKKNYQLFTVHYSLFKIEKKNFCKNS